MARLLLERPKTRAIAIPGIAGMGGPKADATEIVTLDADPRIFARV